jgi:hypothetical protein
VTASKRADLEVTRRARPNMPTAAFGQCTLAAVSKPKNDRSHAATKFCLSMEEHRRTEAGRVRTARELVMHFFPYDESGATDRLFKLMPNEVRGPVLSGWGIRGGKAALKDDDEKVKDVVHDALVAGDVDENAFEEGISAQLLIDWVALPDWWSFWRQGKLSGVAIQRALAVARELELIDDRWFFANLQGRGGRLKGTDVVCDTLGKDQIVAWIRKLHESGDGTPAGLVAALGWETILAKTSQEALLFALDAFAKKAGLVAEPAPAAAEPDKAASQPKLSGAAAAPAPDPSPHDARTDAPAAPPPDHPIDVAIPDIPIETDSELLESSAETTPTAWTTPSDHESPKLAEARAKMMEMLGKPEAEPAAAAWGGNPSDKPAALDWEAPAAAAPAERKPSKPPPLPRKGPMSSSGS